MAGVTRLDRKKNTTSLDVLPLSSAGPLTSSVGCGCPGSPAATSLPTPGGCCFSSSRFLGGVSRHSDMRFRAAVSFFCAT